MDSEEMKDAFRFIFIVGLVLVSITLFIFGIVWLTDNMEGSGPDVILPKEAKWDIEHKDKLVIITLSVGDWEQKKLVGSTYTETLATAQEELKEEYAAYEEKYILGPKELFNED